MYRSTLWGFPIETQRHSHQMFRIMCRFVWIPKYRTKVFEEPYREMLKKIIGKIGYDYNIEIVELEISEDHIHMVVRSEPRISPSDTMHIVKSLAAREFF